MKRFLLMAAVALFACVSEKQQEAIDLSSEIEASPEKVSDDIVMTPPVQLLADDDFLICMAPGMGRSILFLDKTTGNTYYWGQMGSGPDDFVSPKCIRQENHRLTIYDVNLRKAVEYEVHSGDSVTLVPIRRQTVQTGEIQLIDLHTMDHRLSVGLVGIGCPHQFVLLDEEMNVMKSFGDFPMEGLPKDNYLSVYGCLSSWQNKLFFACLPTGYVACYDIDREGNVRKEWEHFLTQPSYDSSRGKWNPDNRNGIYDMKATCNYLFLAFSGKAFSEASRLPQNILVFTHDGKLVRNIKCKDAFIGRLAVDGDYIYASGIDDLTRFNWKRLL